jgi:hypothetical protein
MLMSMVSQLYSSGKVKGNLRGHLIRAHSIHRGQFSSRRHDVQG